MRKSTGARVEAILLTEDNVEEVANFSGGQIVEERHAITGNVSEALNVTTQTGRDRLSQGQYLIKTGEVFYIFGPVQFESQYEREGMNEKPSGSVYDNPFANMERFGRP